MNVRIKEMIENVQESHYKRLEMIKEIKQIINEIRKLTIEC